MKTFSNDLDGVSGEKKAKLICLYKEDTDQFLKEFALIYSRFTTELTLAKPNLNVKDWLICASYKLEIQRDDICEIIFKSESRKMSNYVYDMKTKFVWDKGMVFEAWILSI